LTALNAIVSGDGPETIVLVHGFAGCAGMWGPVLRLLPKSVRVIAYDLPGHGGSLGFPGAGPAKVATGAILDDFARRGIAKAHFVGHSMGGAFSALLAIAAPQSVASLTLLAPGGFGAEINGRLLARYAVAREPAEIVRCLEGMFGWSSPIPDETVEILARMRAVPGQVDFLAGLVGKIARDGRQGVIPREQLAALKMPVAVLWGTLDGVLPCHQSQDLPPAFALHTAPGIGHMLAEEAPDLVARIILATAALDASAAS
jgi:pyruvate dehydrogenase E2 component (dihydrolipoamide acetyltransferase)